MQQYDVVYQSGGEEHTERVSAPDAATAASHIQTEHGREEGLFELIAVNLIEDGAKTLEPAEDTTPDTLTLDETLRPS